MQDVRIYQESKNAMQSGRAKAGRWVVEPELMSQRRPEPMMGWTQSGDTLGQQRILFDNQKDAEEFAKSKGWRYTICLPKPRKVKPRNYSDNHKYEQGFEG